MIAVEAWIGSAAIAAVTALLTYLTARNRNAVDAGQSVVEAASKVVEALQATHAMDRDTIARLVAERDALRGDVARLTEVVEALRADVGEEHRNPAVSVARIPRRELRHAPEHRRVLLRLSRTIAERRSRNPDQRAGPPLRQAPAGRVTRGRPSGAPTITRDMGRRHCSRRTTPSAERSRASVTSATEFKKFLNEIERHVTADHDIHIVMDNDATHKTPAIRDWFARHPRWHIHFAPTGDPG